MPNNNKPVPLPTSTISALFMDWFIKWNKEFFHMLFMHFTTP